jgi:hypothetical protein
MQLLRTSLDEQVDKSKPFASCAHLVEEFEVLRLKSPVQLTGGPGTFTRPVADSGAPADTLTEAARGAKTRRKNKRSGFHSHEPATTDTLSYVCDLTADSDPDVNTETSEVEADVDMSWEMGQG